jgi:tetratricopeptide (TPR) repeat protein
MTFNRLNKAAEFYGDGVRCLRAGQFTEAITLLNVSIELNPESHDTLAAQSLAAHEEGRHDLLHSSIMRLLEFSGGEAALRRATAVELYDGGFYLEAVTSVLEALVISPKEPLSCYILGRSYLALQMFSEAERVFNRALILAPDFKVVESHLLWLKSYLSVPEQERIPLLRDAPRVRMHCHPLDVREMKKYPFTADSIRDLYGEENHGR